MIDEEILQLTPIHGKLDGGLYTSDSDVSLPRHKPRPRHNPHTPLHPRPGGVSRPAGDLPTPINPYAGGLFLATPAHERAARSAPSSSLAAFASAPRLSRTGGSDGSDADAGEGPASASRTPPRAPGTPRADDEAARAGEPRSSDDAARQPRSAPRAASSHRRRRRDRDHGRRPDDAADADDAHALAPVLDSLHALARELRVVFAHEAAAAAAAPDYAHARAYARADGGVGPTTGGLAAALAHGGGPAGARALHAPFSSTYARGLARSPFSLATRLQLAAARSHALGGVGEPVHRSSFMHGGNQYVVTVSLR
ncbi:hypothetical protein KFE25_002152 [Diacronema lutheri]|uniref:Uncharacterized protein n=1 Tax=Diacronema lutheri TaxID=2081491 RepID=A0A8J5XLK5_DIALT|nr:hypothetical protein KFE25_002152 [Diacronema lutheri]